MYCKQLLWTDLQRATLGNVNNYNRQGRTREEFSILWTLRGEINQEVIVTYNVRGMEKVWRPRDYKRVGISTYLLLDFEARVFTYYAPCND